MSDELTHLDLFSGIGGFSLAFEAEGFRTIGFSEIDPYASAVLKKHWPEVPNYGDVRNVPAIRCDVLTGGFPCQPFSVAGKRRGTADDRAIWPEMFAVIKRCRPAFVLGENVPGIVNMELDRVLSDLESEGYACRPFIVPACAVDARHRRDRVWILGRAVGDSAGTQPQQPMERDNGSGRPPFGLNGAGEALADPAQGRIRRGNAPRQTGQPAQCGEALADANEPGSQRRNGAELPECSGEWITRERNPRQEEPAIWLPEPELGRVAHGIPHRAHRLKCLGNSIVPQVAQIFARAIKSTLTRPDLNDA